jgi:NAD(P)-dependent dehydrogenase (short-subunit alcohol dehydrogenase family)
LALIGRTKLDEETSATRDVDDAALLGVLHQTLTASGQSLTPLQLSARAQDILYGRKIRRTIAQLQHVGAEPLYLTADVADTSQLADALALVRSKWGRIDGIIHGAGVLADRLIVDKTDEQFAKVFRTKVDGLRSFLEATEQDDLKFITLFSSVAARYGNVGQCDYAAANEVMNKVARAEALRRGNGCRIKSLNWAPWDSGMMTDALRRQFLERGISLIPEQIGAQAFVAELMSNGPDVDLVIRHANGGAGLGAADETAIYSTKRTN